MLCGKCLPFAIVRSLSVSGTGHTFTEGIFFKDQRKRGTSENGPFCASNNSLTCELSVVFLLIAQELAQFG